MVHFRMVTRAVGPHQGVKRLATAFKGQPTPPFFMISLPSPTPNSHCLNQLSSSHGTKKNTHHRNIQPFISFCYMDGKNRLHNYGRANSIFFCGLSPNYTVHDSMLLSYFTFNNNWPNRRPRIDTAN